MTLLIVGILGIRRGRRHRAAGGSAGPVPQHIWPHASTRAIHDMDRKGGGPDPSSLKQILGPRTLGPW